MFANSFYVISKIYQFSNHMYFAASFYLAEAHLDSLRFSSFK